MKASDYYENTYERTAAWTAPGQVKNAESCHFEPFSRRIMSLGTGGSYLDIGCQAGGLVRMVKPAFDACYGIDIGNYDRQWSQLPDCKFTVHDVDSAPLPFADALFRVVSCIMVLEHVFDVFGLLREIRRVLRSKGTFIIEVPNAGYIKHILALINGRVPRTAAQLHPFSELEGWDGQHLHYFTVSELTWLLNYTGFKIDEVFSRGRYAALRKIHPSLLCSSIAMVASLR